MTSTLPPLVQAISGAIGSTTAKSLTYPLDLVTTRLQLEEQNNKSRLTGISGGIRVLQHIIKKHGIDALYDGLLTDAFATFLSNFFYFYFYSWLRALSTKRALFNKPSEARKLLQTKSLHKPKMIEELMLGFLAGVASRAITTPLNIITLRLQTEREDEEEGKPNASATRGVASVVKLIYEERGLVGFWRGFKTATILSLNPSITLTIFQLFRRTLTLLQNFSSAPSSRPQTPANPSPGQAFIGGAISNSIAVSLLYPLILAKVRLQSSSATSLTDALIDAYEGSHFNSQRRREHHRTVGHESSKPGIRGLYQGLQMQVIKGFFTQGVTLLVKGRVEQLIVSAYVQRLKGPSI